MQPTRREQVAGYILVVILTFVCFGVLLFQVIYLPGG